MGNSIKTTNVNVGRITLFVRIVSVIFILVLALIIQSTINSMTQVGFDYLQLFITVSAISIIIGMFLTLKIMKTGAVIMILGSIGLGISVCIGSNGVSHIFPLALAVGVVFMIIPFAIGLVFLIIGRYI